MRRKAKNSTIFNWNPTPRDWNLINGQLFDQRREDVYVILHTSAIR
ncbi:hypothetical protein [Arthrobacter sp. M4]|nr:hypothetical protein [Arthrobacter sp. M4]MCA4133249.1 hypothetical protein [Arthrobacter sp. M4]